MYVGLGIASWTKQLFIIVSKKYLFINRLVILGGIHALFPAAYGIFYKLIDKGIVELIGPFGIVSAIQHLLHVQHRVQTGLVYHYAGYILIGIIIVTHFLVDSFFI